MKKIRKFWQDIPRTTKIILNLLLIVTFIFLIYTFIGSPSFSARQAFRRAEKANLVGPGTILAQLKPDGGSRDRIILAQTDEGVMLYRYRRDKAAAREIIYRQKTDGLAILTVPENDYRPSEQQMTLPIYLFDDCADAVRAELDITFSTDRDGEHYEKTYSLSAQREGDGYFAFSIFAQNAAGLGTEGYALHLFRVISGNTMGYWEDVAIPAAVRFYDESGQLLRQQSLVIRSQAVEAHLAQS